MAGGVTESAENDRHGFEPLVSFSPGALLRYRYRLVSYLASLTHLVDDQIRLKSLQSRDDCWPDRKRNLEGRKQVCPTSAVQRCVVMRFSRRGPNSNLVLQIREREAAGCCDLLPSSSHVELLKKEQLRLHNEIIKRRHAQIQLLARVLEEERRSPRPLRSNEEDEDSMVDLETGIEPGISFPFGTKRRALPMCHWGLTGVLTETSGGGTEGVRERLVMRANLTLEMLKRRTQAPGVSDLDMGPLRSRSLPSCTPANRRGAGGFLELRLLSKAGGFLELRLLSKQQSPEGLSLVEEAD
ncbi:unnamed protein product [Cyprideis torosa]|uniref:Uncharacterized protein n=1 Tax=Cyprideis torosa TaxID=163714 RepID=A0A7R8WDA3_9CRUS|nr:unnamed protein product [Cyprideis torosa]CAG0894378.1 unnamed protein product [Cyprideis torosa]